MTPTYCPMPWIGINYIPTNIAPCIFWRGAGPDLEILKADMHAGKKTNGCEQCYTAERHGVESGRQEAIRMFGTPTESKLQLLTISFDNVCNLKCRGCASSSSHLWHDDEIEIYGAPLFGGKYLKNDFDADCTNITHVKISGGELFLSKKADKFFTKLKEQDVLKNIDLGISSNGITLPSPAAVTAMTEAKKCTLSISLDGIGPINDYFRSGSNFDQLVENLKYFKTLKISLALHTTVSIYNVNLLKDIEEYCKLNFPEFELTHRLLLWPEQLSIQNMPEDLKNLVRPIVESYGPKYIDVLEALNTEGKDLYGHFLNFHNKLDNLRNEVLGDANPLLSDYISKNKIQVDSKAFFLSQAKMVL
jgi:sulfatase maturation enzyme AslB (radical SAM superfamily)